jgi:hypothetical protein
MYKKKDYHVRAGFMSFKYDQKFPKYCIGLLKVLVDTGTEYVVTIGNRDHSTYYFNLDDALQLVEKYGVEKAVMDRNGRMLYVVPVEEMRRTNDYDSLFDF